MAEPLSKRRNVVVDWDQASRRQIILILACNYLSPFEAMRIRTVCRELHDMLNKRDIWVNWITQLTVKLPPREVEEPRVPMMDFVQRNVLLNYHTSAVTSAFDTLKVTSHYHYLFFWLFRWLWCISSACVEQTNHDIGENLVSKKHPIEMCWSFSEMFSKPIVNGHWRNYLRASYRQAYMSLIADSMLLMRIFTTFMVCMNSYTTKETYAQPHMCARDIFVHVYNYKRASYIYGKPDATDFTDMYQTFQLDLFRLQELIKTRPTKVPGGPIDEPMYLG